MEWQLWAGLGVAAVIFGGAYLIDSWGLWLRRWPLIKRYWRTKHWVLVPYDTRTGRDIEGYESAWNYWRLTSATHECKMHNMTCIGQGSSIRYMVQSTLTGGTVYRNDYVEPGQMAMWSDVRPWPEG